MLTDNEISLLRGNYKVPFYLRSATMQTIWGALTKKNKSLPWEFHQFPLADGDFHDCSLLGNKDNPIWLIIPGMGGDWRSATIRHVAEDLLKNNWQVAVLNHRGFGKKLNYKLQTTHAGNYQDLAAGIESLRKLRPGMPIYACGISLGASQLIHYLAHEKKPLLEAACAVSTPFDLSVAQNRTPKFYQYYIMRDLREHYRLKQQAGMQLPVSNKRLSGMHTFRQFDSLITAPLYGFTSVDDYYQQSSSLPLLHEITTPTLLVHAADDPFFPGEFCPDVEDLPQNVKLLLLKYGGHGGFWSRDENKILQPYWLAAAKDFFAA